jgi:sulfur carrier protein
MAIITVNGNPQDVPEGTGITVLLTLNSVPQPDMVSVQLNGDFVLREDYATTVLKDGDEIDFLYFMGGGSNSITNYISLFTE